MAQPTSLQIEALRQKAAREPKNPSAIYDLAHALAEARIDDEAERYYKAALALAPIEWPIYNNLGVLYRRQARYAEARAALDRAVQLYPNAPQIQFNRAQLFADIGEPELAIAACQQSLAPRPGHVPTLVILARALFLAGRLPEAFAVYEARFQPGYVPYPSFAQPAWPGGDPIGKRILVVGEQGTGDTIQFSRFLPLLAQRGAEAMVLCHPELHRLFTHSFTQVRVLVRHEQAHDPIDFHVPIVTLARHFGTSLETIPADVPYLRADAVQTRNWRERLSSERRLKVGLVWAGSPTHANDHHRSMRLEQFAALMQIENISFYSLQKGPAASQLAGSQMPIMDLLPDLHDYVDTAAALEALDLLITVDTSVAHLAGALARPVWTLLQYDVDWRWMLNRNDSPWYPTMRLFRQAKPNDWASVIDRVAQALRDLASKPRS